MRRMNAATPNRQPTGVPTGGQFASSRKAEADVELTDEPVGQERVVDGEPVLDLVANGPYAPITVRMVMPGETYGLNQALINDKGKPLVEFYDARYPHTAYGQFVSRYYLSTLTHHMHDEQYKTRGLDLEGSIDAWTMTPECTAAAIQWAAAESQNRAATPDGSGDDQ